MYVENKSKFMNMDNIQFKQIFYVLNQHEEELKEGNFVIEHKFPRIIGKSRCIMVPERYVKYCKWVKLNKRRRYSTRVYDGPEDLREATDILTIIGQSWTDEDGKIIVKLRTVYYGPRTPRMISEIEANHSGSDTEILESIRYWSNHALYWKIKEDERRT